ncbi:MAG TPA: GNAT family N-acetyltransferase [Chitinophagales bacterium]|nr:GNAT family N-acetyltransferase [Chitinophagales bacterium]
MKIKSDNTFTVQVATAAHILFAEDICGLMEDSAKKRGTGIAKRKPEYITQKMLEGKAIIAVSNEGELAGFCYIEVWEGKNYVANSGLIVSEKFRNAGLAKKIKLKAFELTRKKYPDAKMFGITTSLAVMKINSELGYKPVTFSELTQDSAFWDGCQSCVNYDILMRTERKNCLCTGMLYDPKADKKKQFMESLKKQSVNKKVPSKLSEPKTKSKTNKGSKGATNKLKKTKVKVNV